MKEQIAQNYLEETKNQHLIAVPQGERHALVIGSNQRDNIGSHIAKRLRDKFINVLEFDRESWRSPEVEDIEKYSILIMANGYTYLDWIENLPADKIFDIINDTLMESIVTTSNYVASTKHVKGKKYIVYIGSMAYNHVLNGSSVYCAAKSGLAHFARCMAWELAPKNYNVYCVHPSNTEGTPMTEQTIVDLMRYRKLTREQAEQYWGASLPRLNWLSPQEIADTVAYLVSGKADYMSGSQIELAGGQR